MVRGAHGDPNGVSRRAELHRAKIGPKTGHGIGRVSLRFRRLVLNPGCPHIRTSWRTRPGHLHTSSTGHGESCFGRRSAPSRCTPVVGRGGVCVLSTSHGTSTSSNRRRDFDLASRYRSCLLPSNQFTIAPPSNACIPCFATSSTWCSERYWR